MSGVASEDKPPPDETPAGSGEVSPATGSGATPGTAVRSAAARLSPPVLAVSERVVNILEVADRPLGRVGDSVRRVIGWVAIATVGTSVIVFLYSLI